MTAICSCRWLLSPLSFIDNFNKLFTCRESCALVSQDMHALQAFCTHQILFRHGKLLIMLAANVSLHCNSFSQD